MLVPAKKKEPFVKCIISKCNPSKEYNVLIVATPSALMLRSTDNKLWVLPELRTALGPLNHKVWLKAG